MLEKIFWGAVFLLHPFIIRTSEILGLQSNHIYKIFAVELAGGIRNAGRVGRDTFFVVICALAALLFKDSRDLPQSFKIILGGILGLSFLTIHDFISPGAIYQLIMLSAGIALFASMYKKTGIYFERYVLNLLLISGIIHSGYVIFEYFNIRLINEVMSLIFDTKILKKDTALYSGILNHPNLSGAYIAFCCPSFFRKRFWWLTPLPLLAVLLLGSAMPLVSLLAGLGAFIWFKKVNFPMAPFLISGMVMLALCFTGMEGLDNNRLNIWKQAYSFLGDDVLFGKGLGFFRDYFRFMGKGLLSHARQEHNEFLSLYLALGAVGCASMAYLMKEIVGKHAHLYAGLFAVFINCFGNFTFHVSTLALVGIFYLSANLKSRGDYVAAMEW